MFQTSFVRRARAAFAFALAASALLAGCATAKPAAVAGSCGHGVVAQPTLRQEPLDIAAARGRAHFVVELAATPGQQELGLMCRTALAADRGMLFDFHTPHEVAFWMHNTLIPLDMVFIGADGQVFSIASARPLDDTPVPAGGPIRAVLEIPGGRAAQLGLLPGDRVFHRIFPR